LAQPPAGAGYGTRQPHIVLDGADRVLFIVPPPLPYIGGGVWIN